MTPAELGAEYARALARVRELESKQAWVPILKIALRRLEELARQVEAASAQPDPGKGLAVEAPVPPASPRKRSRAR